MKTIRAVYENGVFKPIEPVELPEHCPVNVEPALESTGDRKAATSADLARFHGVLKDLAEDPMEFQRRIRSEWD
jgi:predicted DNA-binding antitoxin AbrB/MazE fold protein